LEGALHATTAANAIVVGGVQKEIIGKTWIQSQSAPNLRDARDEELRD
jgi:hypothetical protein